MRNLWLDGWIVADGSPSSAVPGSAFLALSHHTNNSSYLSIYLLIVSDHLPTAILHLTSTQEAKAL